MSFSPRFALAVAAITLFPLSAWSAEPPGATATFIDVHGEEIGAATLHEGERGLTIMLDVDVPGGLHGFHIHETGTCTPPDFKSAGGHFNPHGAHHGTHNPKGAHAGDMPNILVEGPTGYTGKVEAPYATLHKGDTAVLDEDGAALVIHAEADDYTSNPSGNAGARIACGVIVGASQN